MRDGVAEIFDCSACRGVEIARAGAGCYLRGPVPPNRATTSFGREILPYSTCCVEQASGLPRASHRRRKGCLTRPILRVTGSLCSSKSLDPTRAPPAILPFFAPCLWTLMPPAKRVIFRLESLQGLRGSTRRPRTSRAIAKRRRASLSSRTLTLSPQPSTLNREPLTLHPKPENPDLKL